MDDQVVVHSSGTDAVSVDHVMNRLKSRGVKIIEETPNMLLVTGDKEIIDRLLTDTPGWTASALAGVPHPRTRERVLRRP